MFLTVAKSLFSTGERAEEVILCVQHVIPLCMLVVILKCTPFSPYSSTDVHTVASLLKLYIRELPEPIIPFSKYTQFLSCAQLLSKDKETVQLSFELFSSYCFNVFLDMNMSFG